MAAEQNQTPVPTEADLAFFAPRGVLHGFDHVITGHANYWSKQMGLAQNIGEPAREDVAKRIWHWLTLDGKIPKAGRAALVLAGALATPEELEGWRRTLLGGLAASMAMRKGFDGMTGIPSFKGKIVDMSGNLLDALALRPGETSDMPKLVADLTYEDSERRWPHEPRFHIALPPGELPADSTTQDVWTQQGRLLVCRRYPADITTPTEAYMLSQHGIVIDTERTVTVIPHLIAQNSPQFG